MILLLKEKLVNLLFGGARNLEAKISIIAERS